MRERGRRDGAAGMSGGVMVDEAAGLACPFSGLAMRCVAVSPRVENHKDYL